MLRLLRFFLAGFILIASFSCNQKPAIQQLPDSDAALRIYFFHLTERCSACTAVENETKTVINKYYKTRLDKGEIVFKSFNIDRKENKSLTEKYQISYTTLLLIRADGTFSDFTNNSLNYADMNPAKFEELLKSEIEKTLK